jgi:cytochrome c biogenesis protein CcmG/thiol:disulfide interchange protein DsbE
MFGLKRVIVYLVLSLIGAVIPSSGCDGKDKDLSDLFREARIMPLAAPKEAEDFVLPDVNENEVRLKDFRGNVVVLNIWAMWCGPCREEMPSIERLYQEFKGRNLVVLTVSVDTADTGLVKNFVDKHGYTFPVLHDSRARIMKWFGIRFLPVTFLIDRGGKVVGKAVGPRDWGQASVMCLLEELLSRSGESP